MEIKIKKEAFLKGLTLAQGIADRKSTMPILANTLIRTEGNDTILCAATNLRVSVVAEAKADVIKEGMLSIGAKHLFEIVKNLPGEDIHFKRTENNWAEIQADKAKYRIVAMSGRDFPRLPEHQNVKFYECDAPSFSDMMRKTIISVSFDDSRRHLNGIYMCWDGPFMLMVSTDGHRLSKVEYEIGEGLNMEEGIIIPRKGVLEMRRLLEGIEGTCDLGVQEGNLFIKANDVCLTVKLIDAQFPPYEQVVPRDSDKRAIVNRLLLLDSLKRVAIMSSDKTGGTMLQLTEGQLRITSDNPDLGEAQEDLEISYEGEELSIGFNGRYFIDLISEMNEEWVYLEFNGELDPGLIRMKEDQGYLGVVMPLRL